MNTLKHVKRELTKTEKIGNHTNTSLSTLETTSKSIGIWTSEKPDLIDTCRIFHPNMAEYSFLTSIREHLPNQTYVWTKIKSY